jgi:acyl carrier protein
MDETEQRLRACFSAVLPELTPEEITQATASSVAGWDSVAMVTLLAVVEEEFGLDLADENPARFDSYKSILAYLQEAVR